MKIEHEDYSELLPLWTKVRDVVEGGEEKVKEKGTEYLPALNSQKDGTHEAAAEYRHYLSRASLYGAAGRTKLGLVGAVLRKQPTLVGVPEAEMAQIADAAGRNYEPLEQIVYDTLGDLCTVGRCALLVDKDADPDARPYILKIDAEDVVYWRSAPINGRETPTLIVLRQCYEVPKPSDPIGIESEEKIEFRMLRLGVVGLGAIGYLEGVEGVDALLAAPSQELIYWQEIWRERDGNGGTGKSEFVPIQVIVPTKNGGRFWNEIPCDLVNAIDGISLDPEEPPMLPLVNVVLAHYRNSADYEWGLHLTATPQPWVSGFDVPDGTRLVTGCGYAWVTAQTGANVQYLEFGGAGLGAIKDAMAAKEQQAAVLGSRLLESPKNSAEAYGTVRLRQSGDRSVLSTIASNCSTGITRAVQRFLSWISPAFDAPAAMAEVQYKLSADFDATPLDPAELTALTAALQAGTISWETFVHNLRRGELLPPGVTEEEERRRIQMGAPGRSRKDELTMLQADVQAGRITTATYLMQIQALGMLPGVDVASELAAVEEQKAMALEAQAAAFAARGGNQLPQAEPAAPAVPA